MQNTDPQLIRQELDHYFDFADYYSIQELRNKLDDLESQGVTHIEIGTEDCYGAFSSMLLKAYRERLETVEEAQARVVAASTREAQKRELELRKLAELKKKYESQ
jgi:hypothetical protein